MAVPFTNEELRVMREAFAPSAGRWIATFDRLVNEANSIRTDLGQQIERLRTKVNQGRGREEALIQDVERWKSRAKSAEPPLICLSEVVDFARDAIEDTWTRLKPSIATSSPRGLKEAITKTVVEELQRWIDEVNR